MSEQRNLILAVALSAAVLFAWQFFFAPKTATPPAQTTSATTAKPAVQAAAPGAGQAAPKARDLPRAQALALSPARVRIETPTLTGSVNLSGARFDDLLLRNYHETVDSGSPEIELLTPVAGQHPYYAEFGWLASQGGISSIPGADTQWTLAEGSTLAPGKDVTLQYDNGEGLIFTRRISVDEQYMFTVTDRVQNSGTTPVTLYPYGLVSRHDVPQTKRIWIVHEGFVGVAGGELQDRVSYADLADKNETREFTGSGGWVGITDKYWMATVIPPQAAKLTSKYRAFDDAAGTKAYQAEFMMDPITVGSGASQEIIHRLFAGAKVVTIVQDYRQRLGIPYFDYSVDWGTFWFLTRPIFQALDYIYRYVGNFGLAILVFTVFVKILFFPLANTSYRAMSKMKKLQPEMERLKERFKDDRQAQQQAIMQLYQKEKVNPLAGCLPMLVQIPVFWSLYKVLYVTIDMRHAAFYGWVHDLSAPDPLSLFNLFGLLPITLPSFLMIGVFPLLMGATMWVQTNLNPPAGDPTQQKIIQFMPLILVATLSSAPVGLMIYWSWNNLLSIIQQIVIMKRTGTPVDLFERLHRKRVPPKLPS